MVFKIGLKSNLKMKLEEMSHLTQERKHLRIVLQKISQAQQSFFKV
jgi:regulator of replication initiation timing